MQRIAHVVRDACRYYAFSSAFHICFNSMDSEIHDAHINMTMYNFPGLDVSPIYQRTNGSCSVCQNIEFLKREADETSKKLATILARLVNAKSEANHAHRNFFEKLPNEIISLIFCTALDGVDTSPPERIEGHEGPQKENKLSLALNLA
ncbi:hypothetical protein D9613_001517 [Agrocybe pediades]|uniref:Uncharacterized protein n=1 Tax=Agrocybe pediades TaxID=84607 RepID=A0A8H4R943_9AGAR|nr:hypothetical protein D9613_001517 [Agrocybe pediades]